MTTRFRRGSRVALVLSATLGCGLGCRYRPAVFADRPAVTVVSDDRAISVPGHTGFDERVQLSDIYLRRPLFNVVHPKDFPVAGDVNALDEVPASSWFDPAMNVAWDATNAPAETIPESPLVPLDEDPHTLEDALVVKDARGVRFELMGDPKDHPGLRTGADVIVGRLVRGLGLRAPTSTIALLRTADVLDDGSTSPAMIRLRAWIASLGGPAPNGMLRVSATYWAPGIDVGITSDFTARTDDANDVVDHHDRRTLRAMRVFGAWLGWSHFAVRSTRDVYIGKPGEGHLVHYLVGESRALGTDDISAKEAHYEERGGLLKNLVTFGLAPPTLVLPKLSPYPSLGALPEDLVPDSYDVSPPYSPFVRVSSTDEYWAAKRLLALSDEVLTTSIAAAKLPTEAANHLRDSLRKRRRILIEHAFSQVTPLEPEATSGRSVWLRDRAIAAGINEAADTRYDVQVLDGEGHTIDIQRRVDAQGSVTAIALGPSLQGRVVLHIRSSRKGQEAPRACDVHLQIDQGVVRILAIQH